MSSRLHRRPSRRLTLMIDGSGAGMRLASEIVRLARMSGLPAVGVFHGIAGFARGPHGCSSPGTQPPILVVLTGDPESIDDFANGVAPVLEPGELTVEDVAEIVPRVGPGPAIGRRGRARH